MAPAISVIIPARDAAQTLGDTLTALAAQEIDEPFEVIVADDGSRDQTPQLAQSSPVVTRVLRNEGRGPAAARNTAVAAAQGTHLAFLDADCRPTAQWLAAGVGALQSFDLVIGETRPRPDRPLGPFDRTLWVVGRSPLFESANLFVRRELFERLGGFESWLGPRNGKELGEDVWFGWRAVRAGARIAACREALVHHEVYPRGPLGFATERWRLRFFPEMVGRIPELRRAFLHRRLFLSARAARFDAALVGVALAVLARRPLAAAAALPYLRVLSHDVREPDGARKAAARLAADAVGATALIVGSARSRSPML